MKDFEILFKELVNTTKSANTSCRDFTKLLEGLGFEIVNVGSAGHKIAKHPAISLAEYPNYNCGHNPGATIKRPYIKKLYKFVELHKDVIT
jgi:hypothetical protein